jgi:outer membrane scaffolding protein for murein synthesis (MipA/OmpV family)
LRWLALLGLAAAFPAAGVEGLSGAVTGVALWGPEYKGSADSNFAFRPGLLIRYGRVTVSSGAGFAARREDAERRGLGIDLTSNDTLDLSLGLRLDNGRDESSSPALAGMGDVKRTLRVRVGGSWRFAPRWQLSGNWTLDAFNRGGGNIADAKIQYEWPVTPRFSLTPAASITIGGPRYMRTWYGVDEEQSAQSGYPVYEPGMGVRDVSFTLAARAEIGEHWVLIGGPGYTRLLGPAGRSPIVQRRSTWSANAGVGYRF